MYFRLPPSACTIFREIGGYSFFQLKCGCNVAAGETNLGRRVPIGQAGMWLHPTRGRSHIVATFQRKLLLFVNLNVAAMWLQVRQIWREGSPLAKPECGFTLLGDEATL